MKKTYILILILLILAAAAYFLTKTSAEKNQVPSDRDFAVNAGEIGRIEIQKVGFDKTTFELQENGWWKLNDNYRASKFVMPYLLQSLSKIEIQNIPPKNAYSTIYNNIKKIGINIKVFDKSGNKLKDYWMGLKSPDGSGVICMMDGSNQPYNMHIRGFDGDFRQRFVQPIDKWRDREIFQYKPEQIAEIIVEYPKAQKSSFHLKHLGKESFEVTPVSQFIKKEKKEVNVAAARSYLAEYGRKYAEDFDNENVRRDSIAALIPFASVTVVDKSGDKHKADFYPFRDFLLKNVNTREQEELKKIERFFVNSSRGDFMVIQKRNFESLLRPYDFFFTE